VSIQPNWHSPLDEADVFEFHQQVADATEFPLLSYTVASPGMSPALVARFATELPVVIGMKNDSDQFYAYYDYLRAANGRLTVISGGQMRNILFGYQFGSRAYLCGNAPFAPWISSAFFDHLVKGELAAAAADTLRYEAPLLDVALHIRGSWLPFIKSVLFLRGLFRTNRLRLPYPTHRPDELTVIEAMLARLSIAG
jgi:dihydrodipicolinate synthase/N-acetylneuraminate lyase